MTIGQSGMANALEKLYNWEIIDLLFLAKVARVPNSYRDQALVRLKVDCNLPLFLFYGTEVRGPLD